MELFSRIFSVIGELAHRARALFTDGMRFMLVLLSHGFAWVITLVNVTPKTFIRWWGQPHGDHRWSTFIHNHAAAILACDFCVVVTATFRLLYVEYCLEAKAA